jgi:hypothetical protein
MVCTVSQALGSSFALDLISISVIFYKVLDRADWKAGGRQAPADLSFGVLRDRWGVPLQRMLCDHCGAGSSDGLTGSMIPIQ